MWRKKGVPGVKEDRLETQGVKTTKSGYSSRMSLAVLMFPVILMLFLWLLPWLEEQTLAPDERANRIKGFLEQHDPEAIEKEVAELLASSGQVRSKRRI